MEVSRSVQHRDHHRLDWSYRQHERVSHFTTLHHNGLVLRWFFLLACHTTGLSTTLSPTKRIGWYTVVSLLYDLCLWPHLLNFFKMLFKSYEIVHSAKAVGAWCDKSMFPIIYLLQWNSLKFAKLLTKSRKYVVYAA